MGSPDGYGKQEALDKQTALFTATIQVEHDWLRYSAWYKAMSNWSGHAAFPFGDPDEGASRLSFSRSAKNNRYLHSLWRDSRARRVGYADREHPFRLQGAADINTYKLFLESALVLSRVGGRIGFLVPSGLYTDKGSTELRSYFLERCKWEWLFSFINWNKIFEQIYYRFKFALCIVEKGSQTNLIRGGFGRYHIEEWEQAEKYALAYPAERVRQFSPRSKAILEIRHQRDLEVLEKLYANSVLLGDDGPDGWGIRYAREFDMTNDSKLFPPRPKWEEKGYRPDEYSHWLKGRWKPYDGPRSILKRPDGLILSRDGAAAIHIDDRTRPVNPSWLDFAGGAD